jgi:heme exporter protein C
VRAATPLTHPRVLSTTGGALPGSMRLTFIVCLLGMAALFVTLCKYELASKHATFRLRALKRQLESEDDGWVPVRRTAAPQL